MRALFGKEEIEALRCSTSRLAQFVGSLLALYAGTYERELGFYACPVHDALCIGVLVEPTLVEMKIPQSASSLRERWLGNACPVLPEGTHGLARRSTAGDL